MPVKTHQDILNDIGQLDHDEKSLLFSALEAIQHSTASNINQIAGDLREAKFSGGFVCLHCGGEHVVRNGKFHGRQRFLCRDCNRTFNDFTNTPMQRTQLPEKWLPYLECMHNGLSLRKAAEEIGGVTHVTLFHWRHKILSALKNLDADHFDGIMEIDETYLLYSEKGQKHITGRKPRHRGGKATKRGISDEQVGILVVCDRQKQNSIKVAGSGRISADTLETMVANKLGDNLTLCSDADSAIRSFAAKHDLEHVELNAKQKQRVKHGIYHIQNVNSCHCHLKDWISHFKGVATKYLDNYLAWFRYITATKNEAMASKRKQMLLAASQFNIISSCKSLRVAKWDHATV